MNDNKTLNANASRALLGLRSGYAQQHLYVFSIFENFHTSTHIGVAVSPNICPPHFAPPRPLPQQRACPTPRRASSPVAPCPVPRERTSLDDYDRATTTLEKQQRTAPTGMSLGHE